MSEQIIEAIERIQKMRDETQAYYDENNVEGEWLDNFGSWVSHEAEADDRETAAELDAFGRVLDVLQSIAHGITPAQGS